MFGKGYEKTKLSATKPKPKVTKPLVKPSAKPLSKPWVRPNKPALGGNSLSSNSDSSSDSDATSESSENPQPYNELATDESIYSIIRPAEIRSEHFDYSWKLENYAELETRLLNAATVKSNDNENTPEDFIVKSNMFQCGLMADRLAQWHLEMDLASTAEGMEKYVGLHLVLEKILWRNDQQAEIYVNAQLLDASGRIFESCKSPTKIKFGPKDKDKFTRYGWNDFITHEKLLKNKTVLVGDTNKLRVALRMDIRGSSGPRSMSIVKESTQKAINEKRLKRNPMDLLSTEFFENVSLKKKTEDLWRSGRGSDITIKAGAKEFKAHKVILRSGSLVFADLLREKKRNESPNLLKIDDFEPDIVENLLEYLYTETCPAFNDLTKASELLKVGHRYKVRYLKKNLMENLLNTLNVKNALQTLLFAHAHDAFSYYIEQFTWYCQKHAAAIQQLESYADLYALDPDFFSNIFKPKTPEPDYFM